MFLVNSSTEIRLSKTRFEAQLSHKIQIS